MNNKIPNKYKVDSLFIFSLGFGLLLYFTPIGRYIGVFFIAYAICRVVFHNNTKRNYELAAFEKLVNNIKMNLQELINTFKLKLNGVYSKKEGKKYTITICPMCQQKLRLPKSKGLIQVACPKCSKKFDFKT